MKISILPFLCIALVMTGCTGLRIAKPTLPPDVAETPVEPSSVEVPIQAPIDLLRQTLENQVPSADHASGPWGDTGQNIPGVNMRAYQEHEVWRDPLSVTIQGNQLSIGTTAHYWVKIAVRVRNGIIVGGYSWHQVASCGPNDAILRIDSTISIGDDYTIHSVSRAEPVNCPQSCLLTALNFDGTSFVRNLFQSKLNEAASSIDSKIPTLINLGEPCSDAWDSLQSPIQIETNIWLVVHPDTVSASTLSGTGQNVTETVGIRAHPEIIIGTEPRVQTNSLPQLIQGSLGNGFHVALDAILPFKSASKQVSDALVGRVYPLYGHSVTIKGASVYGTGLLTVLQLKIGGDIKGTIYLVGRPSFDPLTAIFSISDLDYSLETKNVLAKVADWLLHSGFRDSLADEAKWDLSTQISSVQAKLQAGLNRQIGSKITTTTGDVSHLSVMGIYSTPISWRVRVVTDGMLSINVKP